MRLIDADKLKLCYTGTNGLDDKAEYDSIRKMIDLQPTAYDVDKVVERLNEYAHSNICDSHNGCPYVDDKNMNCENCGAMGALKIVKSGGIE